MDAPPAPAPASADSNTNAHNTSSLAINPVQSELPVKRHRSQQSCEHCRRRKTRCEYSDSTTRSCRRCLKEQKRCEFSAERYKRRGSQARTANRNGTDPLVQDNVPDFQLSPDQQANVLVDLGQIDMQSPQPCHPLQDASSAAPVTIPLPGQSGDGMANLKDSLPGRDAKNRLISTQLHNAADALDLLTFAATEEQYLDNVSRSDLMGSESIRNGNQPEYDKPLASGENGTLKWKNFHLIRRGILSEDEAIEYVRYFFDKLWPLKPVIPAYYADPSMYSTLATEEPVLLTTMIVLASRYHQLPGYHGAIRSERIHWHTWRSLKRSLQSAMWGSICTRSLGTIASMLLLMEWHPKAINNPSMFADDDDISEYDGMHKDPDIRTTSIGFNLTTKQRHGMMSLLENLNILSSAYRSNSVSWMLLSNAIALAQEGCCFETEVEGQPSSQSEAAAAQKVWKRTICVFVYLADEHMALRLGLEPLLPEKSRRIVKDRFSKVFASALPNSELWESVFELTDEIRKARELLRTSKQPSSRLNSDELVAELEYVKRSLDRWKRQHTYAGHDENSPLNACLSIEFYYAVIYSLSPAAYATATSTDLRQAAVEAARDMLALVVNVLEPTGVLRVLPVRCWLFVTTAGLHLLKDTVSQNPNFTEAHQDVKILRATVQALHQGSPDDVHTAVRFSRFFGVLLDAVLRPSTARSHADNEIPQSDLPMLDPADSANFSHLSSGLDLAALPADLENFCDSTWWDEALYFRRVV
ncbi:hypothetical protein ONS95_009432 [Cadophora gregata]|uniref:uncharacterized protein n=1 Tax=Cadophora gregata TaxID=51156 RepID=UPI0026DC2DA8|nr:uncharacterized protein ONS95_009432 [Cadophora gregata]KAK0124480.1 hypothetical protein ONS95_009432 [Cadophora gregata]KAK0129666.1 hypothetical protein ONS96_000229 [Cadophora gregata f. sp. sojae]